MTAETGFPLTANGVEELWSELISAVCVDDEDNRVAAMMVTDPDTLEQSWHYGEDVEVGVWLRPRHYGADEAAYYAKLPLLALWKRLDQFDILEIGASSIDRPIFLGAVACEHDAGSTYASVVADWRGVGQMAASRTYGDVLTSLAERSGVPGVNSRREHALAVLESEYGPKARDIARQSSFVTILEQFAASNCFAWFIYRMSPDPTVLVSGPVRKDERRLAEVLSAEIDRELSVSVFGATRPEYEKALQWRRRYDDELEADDEYALRLGGGVFGPSQARVNLTRGVAAFDEPADVLGIQLADDDLWPSQLHSLNRAGFTWPELLRHAVAFRDKRGLSVREGRVANLYQAGFTRREIAAREGVHESTVSRDLIRAGRKVREYNRRALTDL